MPDGGAGVVLTAGVVGLFTMTVKGAGWFCGVCALSVAVTVNEKEPFFVGKPDSNPSFPSARPGGAVPAVIAQENGGEPPLAMNVKPA